jgi:hypothetical protein
MICEREKFFIVLIGEYIFGFISALGNNPKIDPKLFGVIEVLTTIVVISNASLTK